MFRKEKTKKKPKFLYETYPRNPAKNKQETLVTFRKEKWSFEVAKLTQYPVPKKPEGTYKKNKETLENVC